MQRECRGKGYAQSRKLKKRAVTNKAPIYQHIKSNKKGQRQESGRKNNEETKQRGQAKEKMESRKEKEKEKGNREEKERK